MPRLVNECKEQTGVGRNGLKAGAIERMSRTVSFWSRTGILAVSVVTAAGAAIGGGAAASACTTTTAVNAALVAGIQINTSLLLGDNLGCGTTDLDVYKYVAVAINDSRDVGGAGVVDCYANAVFGNLPGTDAGSLDFGLWIYAYNERDWSAANANDAITSAVTALNGVYQPDGSMVAVPISVVPDGGTSQRGYPAALSTLCLSKATWVTTCTAASQPGVQILANCGALELEDAAPRSCALPVLIPDAGHD
jgi:hypothetical protein